MILKLTPEQCDAIDQSSGPVPVEDGRTHRTYYLIDEATFSNLQNERDIEAIHAGVADMEAGRVMSLDELDARIQKRLELHSK